MSESRSTDASSQNGNSETTPSTADDHEIGVARTLFFAGCFFLPWLWIVNVFYFRHSLFDTTAPADLRLWIWRSGIGAVVMTVMFLSWIAIFQTQYESWGDAGRSMLVYQPEDKWWLLR